MLLYALHDGLVKPMPGKPADPCLAESYTASRRRPDPHLRAARRRQVPQRRAGDGGGRQVLLRALSRQCRGLHQGATSRRSRRPIRASVVFRLNKPWPDFLLYYSSVTGAGWIVPKKYVESVGEDGFKKAPIGAGPYKFVSFTPGVELVMEAFDGYWRKTPTREAAGLEGDPRRGDAAGGAEARRGRHRLLDPRRAGRGAAAHAGAAAEAGGDQLAVLDLLRRPVGPEVAVARSAGAQGRRPWRSTATASTRR